MTEVSKKGRKIKKIFLLLFLLYNSDLATYSSYTYLYLI